MGVDMLAELLSRMDHLSETKVAVPFEAAKSMLRHHSRKWVFPIAPGTSCYG